MGNLNTSFEVLANIYNNQIGIEGDYNHKYNIDPSLLKYLGNIKGKIIYDIGCGNGHLDFILSGMQAKKIYASDIAPSLIDYAKERHRHEINCCEFFVSEGSDFSYFKAPAHDKTVDIVISNMAVHYIENIDQLARDANKLLNSNGLFVFTIAHPMDDLLFYKNEPNLQNAIDAANSYLSCYSHLVSWAGYKIDIFKRPISFYLNTFINNGFDLVGMEELPRIYTAKDGTTIITKLPGFITFCFKKSDI